MCKYAVFKVNFQLVIHRMTTRLPPSLQFKRAARKQEEMRVQRASAVSQTFKAAAWFSHSDKNQCEDDRSELVCHCWETGARKNVNIVCFHRTVTWFGWVKPHTGKLNWNMRHMALRHVKLCSFIPFHSFKSFH